MKILHKLSLVLLMISPTINAGSQLSISEQEINRYLETRLSEKFPLSDRVGVPKLFQLDYKLSNLVTSIGHTEEKVVNISGIVDSLLEVNGKEYQIKLQLNMDTLPYYNAEKGALYLKNVHLKNWSAVPEKYQDELQMFLPMIADGLAGVLNQYPVYTLDETKTKEALIKKFGKQIVVEKGRLRLEVSVF